MRVLVQERQQKTSKGDFREACCDSTEKVNSSVFFSSKHDSCPPLRWETTHLNEKRFRWPRHACGSSNKRCVWTYVNDSACVIFVCSLYPAKIQIKQYLIFFSSLHPSYLRLKTLRSKSLRSRTLALKTSSQKETKNFKGFVQYLQKIVRFEARNNLFLSFYN